jgi:GMP synthase (glutamine-hydrolysing)
MRILYLLHAAFETPGIIESWAAEKEYEQHYASPFAGEPIPRLSFDLIIIMGGPQSALELNTYPYLKDEIDFIRNALRAKIPVLGFCLGAQLIGEAFGASTKQSPFREVGVFPITLTEEGILDPLLANLAQEFLVPHWHSDMPGLTTESVVLAKSAGCPRQIIRYSSHAYGFQCHPEMTLQGAEELIKNCPNDFSAENSEAYLQSPQSILAYDFHDLNHSTMICILENFLAILQKDQSQPDNLLHK